MTDKRNADLPAFPIDLNHMVAAQDIGLTKRELFAAMAMQGIESNIGANQWSPSESAKLAVKRADALLAALEEK